MQWSTDKPTEPGWYWWRSKYGIVRIVQVHSWPNPKAGLSFWLPDVNHNVDTTEGEWAGPLEQPNEPAMASVEGKP